MYIDVINEVSKQIASRGRSGEREAGDRARVKIDASRSGRRRRGGGRERGRARRP